MKSIAIKLKISTSYFDDEIESPINDNSEDYHRLVLIKSMKYMDNHEKLSEVVNYLFVDWYGEWMIRTKSEEEIELAPKLLGSFDCILTTYPSNFRFSEVVIDSHNEDDYVRHDMSGILEFDLDLEEDLDIVMVLEIKKEYEKLYNHFSNNWVEFGWMDMGYTIW